jgi:hypothetical protein
MLVGAVAQSRTFVRDQPVEVLRLVAAVGIVLFHAGAATGIAGAGLVIFILLTTAMEAGPNWSRPRSVTTLAAGLLIPWALWWLFYGAVDLARGESLLGSGSPAGGILYGTAAHLWYLPFMFAVLVAVGVAKARLPRMAVLLISGCAAIGLVGLAGLWRPWTLALGAPWAQYGDALPIVFAGLCIGAAVRLETRVLAGAMLVCAAVASALTSHIAAAVPLLAGLIPTLWLLLHPHRPSWNIEWLSRCAFGVYLMHPFWLSALGPVIPDAPMLRGLLAFAISLAVTWGIRRYTPSVARWIV